MATELKQLEKRPHLEIVSRRLTCAGMQYRIADSLGTVVVTVNDGFIGCSCGAEALYAVCEHITLVEVQENAYIEQARQREAYVETFGIYSY